MTKKKKERKHNKTIVLKEDCPNHCSYFLFGHLEHQMKLLNDIIKHPIDDP